MCNFLIFLNFFFNFYLGCNLKNVNNKILKKLEQGFLKTEKELNLTI